MDFNFPVPDVNFAAVTPVLVIVLFGILGLIAEMVAPKRSLNLIGGLSLLGICVAALSVFSLFGNPPYTTFAGSIRIDAFGLGMQLAILLAAGLCILFSEAYLRARDLPYGEIYPLMMWSTAGAMLMASTTSLLMLFVGLEILSISLYVLAGIVRREEKSEESAIKYFLLGSFASGFLLYGIAMIYGATGSLSLDVIGYAWKIGDQTVRTLLGFGMALALVGLGFKSSLVPFHSWTPDVYDGAPMNITAFMASVGKIAAFAALTRFVDGVNVMSQIWLPILSTIAIITMLYGNILAKLQTNVKRILAYSSVANAGYVLVAIIAAGLDPARVNPITIVYFSISYAFMTVGTFAILSVGARPDSDETDLASLNGMWRRSPIAAICLVIFMASLVGLPLTGGFIAKALIFFDALTAGQWMLAIVLAVASVMSVSYYLAIIQAAIVPDGEPDAAPIPASRSVSATFVACAVGVLAVFLFYGPIANLVVGR